MEAGSRSAARRHHADTAAVDNKGGLGRQALSAVTRQYGGKKKVYEAIGSVRNPVAAIHGIAVYDAAGKIPGSTSAAANANLHWPIRRYVTAYTPFLVHTEASRLQG